MIELLTTDEMAEADRLAIAGGIPGIDLMERAGRAVADATVKMQRQRVMVVAGPGNNGGDGFVAARCLSDDGFLVRLCFIGDPKALRGDAAVAAARWRGAVEVASPAALVGSDVVIDALFGAGLHRNVEGLPRAMIDAMNASDIPVVAIDLPSGVNGTSGAVMGSAVNATRTVTFFRRKTGHVLLPGRLHCGTVEVADIGIPAWVLEKIRPRTFADAPDLWARFFPRPTLQSHKYTRGHAVIVSGGTSTTGAARLAARSALRAGAGLATIASPREALAINAAQSVAVMVRPVDGADELGAFLSDKRLNALVVGPGGGLGAGMREQVFAGLASQAAVVLDADALTSFSDQPDSLMSAISRRSNKNVVLTPHEGEFARLFKDIHKNTQDNSKTEKTRLAAQYCAAVVVYKGADTVIAAPDGHLAIADNAPPGLATAGSGDVLSGIIAGLMAQGMQAFEAACAGVWLHGEAAREFGPGLISEDLPEMLPRVYRRLFAVLGDSD